MRLAECSGKKRSPDTYFW